MIPQAKRGRLSFPANGSPPDAVFSAAPASYRAYSMYSMLDFDDADVCIFCDSVDDLRVIDCGSSVDGEVWCGECVRRAVGIMLNLGIIAEGHSPYVTQILREVIDNIDDIDV